MKKTSLGTLSVLLSLLILLPFAIPAIPFDQVAPTVKAASSAEITLDVSEGYVGDYVTVTGRGFTPNKDITFMWGDQLFSSLGFMLGMPSFQRPSYDKPGEVCADALGNFIVQLQVPKLTRGTYTIKADDTVTTAVADFTVNSRVILRNQYAYKKHGSSATPSETRSSAYYIELFLAEGFVGDWLAFELSGFGDGELVEVKMGTISLGSFTMLSGSEKGYLFSISAKRLPEMSGGDYTVTATGKVSGITASASFKVKPELFLSRPPPAAPALSDFPWVYTFANFGLSWYSSVSATADAMFVFEASGLTGEAVSGVSVTYNEVAPISCQVSGTLALHSGSTQGINSTTVPFTWNSLFTKGLSPSATIPSAIPSGNMLTVTITTSGAGGASYSFNKQLFSSSVGTAWNNGSFVWVEGDSTISSNGTSLSSEVNDVNKLAATGLLRYWWTNQWPVAVTSTGSIVTKLDLDAIWGWTLTPYDQSLTPVSFYDVEDNDMWDSSEPVYIDNDNSSSVTNGDTRVTSQMINGKFYPAAWAPDVGAMDPDVGRALTKFPPETRPSYYATVFWPTWVYLDKYGTGTVSEGDVRISAVPLYVWWMWGWVPDVNGFTALSLNVPNMPGAGLAYDVGLWSAWATNDFTVESTVKMEVHASLEVTSASTAYQSTYYVTEGSDNIWIRGRGFRGSEQLRISVGGKYVKTVTPDSYGSFSTDIDDMPALAGGEQTITATGVLTASNNASTTITYTPVLQVSYSYPAYNLSPVTSIMVEGKGFEAGTYLIIFDGAEVGEAVTSSFTVTDSGDEAGQIHIAFNAPEGVEGVHIVDVVNTSDPTISALFGKGYLTWAGVARPDAPFPTDSEFPTVTIWPSLQRTPTTTTVGTSVLVTGKGLQPSTTYYMWYDPRGTSTSQAVLMTTTPAVVITDAKGTLTASFQIPQSSGGTHYIWASTSSNFINNDPVKGSPVPTSVSINPDITLAQYSGVVGASTAVSFTGLSTGSQYRLWWYKPEEATVNDFTGDTEVPQTAILLATATGALYGDSTAAVSFTVPATAKVGSIYCVDLTAFTDRISLLGSPVFFTVGKVSTTITIRLTPETVTERESVTINGVIEPALSVNITLFMTDPDGKTTNKTITSATSGTFTDSFKPDKVGTWQVKAKWDGNSVYAEYTSLADVVKVTPIDTSWMYAWAGIGIGAVALLLAIIITLHYFMRKRHEIIPTT